MLIKRWVFGAFIGALALAFTPSFKSSAQTGKEGPIKLAFRRITETQYRHTIADVFGPGVKINARFEPEKREDGLLAIGSARLSLTTSGFEQYFVLASSISEQVLDEKHIAISVLCKPADPAKADDACARQFIEVQLPAVYYALRRNADFSPTGPNGEKTHISFALRVDALPAFVMVPDASKEVASVESYKSSAPRITEREAASYVVDGIVPDRTGKYKAGPDAVILPPATPNKNP